MNRHGGAPRWLAAVTTVFMLALAASPAHAGACPGDIDGSGDVDFDDLLAIIIAWGPCLGCPADLDGDGNVDFDDLLQVLTGWGDCPGGSEIFVTELAGNALGEFPFFEFVQAFNESEPARVAVDPHAFRVIPGRVSVYVVEAKSAAEWDADPTLTDVRGVPQSAALGGGPDVQDNTILLTGVLSGDAGTGFGRPYDVIIDTDGDGELGPGDFIDGRGDEAGMYVVRDTTALGPLATTSATYSGKALFQTQRVFYPTDIDTMGELPLIVISHGGGQILTWYAYLQEHLASYGYIVMSHQTNAGPGPIAAAATTLDNTNYIIDEQDMILNGVLDGHIDAHRIVWIGQGRGGEGVVYAYTMIGEKGIRTSFAQEDIVLLSSIAPTDLRGAASSPGDANYHLLWGAADGEVSGQPLLNAAQSFHLFERATGRRAATYVHGADHNDFNCCGPNDFCQDGATCPLEPAIGREEAQLVAKGAYLAVVKHFVEGSVAAKEYLWRQYESLKPVGVSRFTVVCREYRNALDEDSVVVDDFQTEPDLDQSSSGGEVTASVENLVEGVLDDSNTTFTWLTSDPMNGMTRAPAGGDEDARGIVFDFSDDASLEFEVSGSTSGAGYLSFRAAQGTRHPSTIDLERFDLTFTVTLEDGNGATSSINIGAYGGGVEPPFRRGGYGGGNGWQNEFETIRIRLTDFQRNGTSLELSNIQAVRFEFGRTFGSSAGRLGIDDIEFTQD